MADLKISALTSASTPLAGTEVLPIVQSSTTKQVSVANLTAGRAISASKVGVGIATFDATYQPILQVDSSASDGTGGLLIGSYLPTLTLYDYSGGAGASQIQQDGTDFLVKNGGATRFKISSTGDITASTGNLVIGTSGKGIEFAGGNGVISVGNSSYNIYVGGGTYTPAEIYIQSTYAYIQAAYNNTTASAANVFVASTGELKRSTSALKYKQDVRDVEDFNIDGLRPVRYKSKCEGDDQTKDHFGLIADEAAEAGFEELVTRSETGEIEGFQYERLTVVLLKKIKVLESRLAALETK